tara:strand:+ start:34 stop:375 length:342 start_codon:yes stop_codon:yes gene_type:complete
MTQEVLKLSQEALAGLKDVEKQVRELVAENKALKKALAQEQEPVAFWNFNSGFSHCMIDQLNEAAKKNPAPLYTTPPQRTWVELTKKEVHDLYDADYVVFHQRIEAKLKERNT